MTVQKNRDTLTLRDEVGNLHTCYRTGEKRIIRFNLNSGIESALITAIRNEFHDSSIRPGIMVKPLRMDVYIIHSNTSLYIARPHLDGSVEIFSNGAFGFPIESGYNYTVVTNGNTIVFWLCDKRTNMRISHYHFVE